MVKGDKQDNTSSNTTVREQGNIPLQCPKLTYTNYTTWALMLETILKAYGLWKVIDETGDKQETSIDEKAENTAKGMIFQTLPQDMLMQVAQYTTAKEVWNSIKVKHIGADLVQKARLQTLRNNGYFLEEEMLNSRPKKFLPIVATIEQYQDLDEMSFEEAVGRLTAFEERIKSQDTLEGNDQDKLLMASSNNQSHGKGRGKNFNKESMKWKNISKARETSTNQRTKGLTSTTLAVMNVVTSATLRGNVRSGNTIKTSKKSLISFTKLTMNPHCCEVK
ncbi:hypothetical protein Tco_0185539 [Tanacetum coccineum]